MGNAVFEAGRDTLAFARRLTLGLLDGFEGDAWFHRPFAGANHALWTLGHIAWADDEFLEKLKGRSPQLPPKWYELFAMGSTVEDEAGAYPDPKELFDALAVQREDLLAWFASMNDEQLAAPLPDDWKSFAPNFGAVMSSIAWHEGFHAGQLSVIRKSLGMPRKFG